MKSYNNTDDTVAPIQLRKCPMVLTWTINAFILPTPVFELMVALPQSPWWLNKSKLGQYLAKFLQTVLSCVWDIGSE